MRNTKSLTITEPGRDQNKVFVLTEMSAMRAEKWAARALCAIVNAGIAIPDEFKGTGMAGIAAIGAHQILNFRFAEFEPLLDEMMSCVKLKPDHADLPPRDIVESADDIAEVSTILQIRREVLLLHTNFLGAAAQSKLRSMLTGAASSTTQTSREPLAQ